MENYENYQSDKCVKEVPIPKLNFFSCDIAIFCGANVNNAIFNGSKLRSKVNALICINTNIYEDEAETDKLRKDLNEIVTEMITKEFLLDFYGKLC